MRSGWVCPAMNFLSLRSSRVLFTLSRLCCFVSPNDGSFVVDFEDQNSVLNEDRLQQIVWFSNESGRDFRFLHVSHDVEAALREYVEDHWDGYRIVEDFVR